MGKYTVLVADYREQLMEGSNKEIKYQEFIFHDEESMISFVEEMATTQDKCVLVFNTATNIAPDDPWEMYFSKRAEKERMKSNNLAAKYIANKG